MRTYCKNGHERNAKNTHIRPNGKRRCRVCECNSAAIRYRVENPEIKSFALRDRCGRGHVYVEGSFRLLKNTIGTTFRLCLICQRDTQKRRNFKKFYGITVEQHEAAFLSQGKCCAVCKSAEPGGRGFWQTDHSHCAGKFRGILCQNCNLALGHVKDSVETLYQLIDYLKRTNNGA